METDKEEDSRKNIRIQNFIKEKIRNQSKIMIRAYSLFHKCELNCLKKSKWVMDEKNCIENVCQKDLDNFVKFKNENEPVSFNNYFYERNGLFNCGLRAKTYLRTATHMKNEYE